MKGREEKEKKIFVVRGQKIKSLDCSVILASIPVHFNIMGVAVCALVLGNR